MRIYAFIHLIIVDITHLLIYNKTKKEASMKSFAVHIQKGGVGKTTIAVNLSFALSKFGRTILIDADPQGTATHVLLPNGYEIKHELGSYLLGNSKLEESVFEIRENLFFFPTVDVNYRLRDFADNSISKQPFCMKKLIRALSEFGFEFCIFDCSPGFGLLESSIYMAVDELLSPVTPEFVTSNSLVLFKKTLDSFRDNYETTIKHDKLIVNMVNKSFTQHNLFMDVAKDLGLDIYIIPQDRKLADSQSQLLSIFEYYQEARSVPELMRLAETLAGGVYAEK